MIFSMELIKKYYCNKKEISKFKKILAFYAKMCYTN